MVDKLSHLLQSVVNISHQAGSAIMNYYGDNASELGVRAKEDKSPVTEADLAAHHIVISGLTALTPELPILSEEGQHPDYEVRQQWQRYWLTDPLDGTRGFVEGSEEFTVNIALIDAGNPVLGVIYSPVLELTYFASRNDGAYRQIAAEPPVGIETVSLNWEAHRVVLGRHIKKTRLLKLYEQEPNCRLLRRNSSLKLGLVADGQADIYPRFGETGEWDTAAGQCIIEAAGGAVVDLENQPLQYNAKPSLINPPFVALGDRTQAEQIINFILEKRRNL